MNNEQLAMPARNHPYRPTAVRSLFTAHSSLAEIYSFSAKERDTETGLSYFGSRYYSSDLSIWLSVDPMSDKYPSLSPYVYCADNPVRCVDPNGETVVIVGDDVDGAVNQLQNQTGLQLSINSDGKLSYSGEAVTKIDKLIANAIDDNDITVNLTSNSSNSFGDYKTEKGGGYMGNTYEGGKVCTDQYVCPSLLAEFDISVGDTKTGLSMVHELAESFYGGQIALQNKKSSPIAGSDGSTYNESHKRANEIAVGNRGPIYLKVDSPGINYSFFKAGDYLHRIGQDGKIDYFHLYIQIGWKRTTDKNGM